MTCRLGQVKALKADVAGLADVTDDERSISKLEAVRLLRQEISRLRNRNLTFDQIAAIVTDKGLEISGDTLGRYFRRLKAQRRQTKEPPAQAPAVQRAEPVRAASSTPSGPAPSSSARVPVTSPDSSGARGRFTPIEDSDDL
jgi:hypothetical protein